MPLAPPIDWGRPWLGPWRDSGQRVAQAVAAGADLPGALNREWAAQQRMAQRVPQRVAGGTLVAQASNEIELPDAAAHPGRAGRPGIEFVPQSALPPGIGYERYMAQTGQCPTRENLHDFFNGLCWLHFPHTKKQLNQLQAAQIAQTGIQPVRGPARDALTVFDENAAFFQGPDVLWNALVAKDWQAVFGTLRPLWADAQLVRSATRCWKSWSRRANPSPPTFTGRSPRCNRWNSSTPGWPPT